MIGTKEIESISEKVVKKIIKDIFVKKTTAFLMLGIALFLSLKYLGTIDKTCCTNIDFCLAYFIILSAIVAQIINWYFFFNEKRLNAKSKKS